MSTLGLFVVGALVMALVGTALGLLVWGAIMDGRTRPGGPLGAGIAARARSAPGDGGRGS